MNPRTAFALDGPSVDGSAYRDVVDLAGHAPGWVDDAVTAWSAYGLGLFAVLMVVVWWRARRTGTRSAVEALAVPVVVVVAYVLNDVLKALVHEVRPCRSLHLATLEACPAPGDWSFPSNHAAIAAAAAVALLFVSRRIGAVAVVAACAMGASRVWVGAHYPHDVVVGMLVGALISALLMAGVRRWHRPLVRLLAATRLRPLLVA
ncbi:phosphatase PAP2 family protein [Streptomyces griseus]|uniref:phosphatase PAP2 family protein n=1 Tax=Streptomyces griseus TaxID=1911 RepID=UPI00083FFBA7|nr:phosphatase PAP2 family protein [Streptomyces griseus]